ncbi:MAG: alkaline phosphatase family protein [Bradymonadia bacterium]
MTERGPASARVESARRPLWKRPVLWIGALIALMTPAKAHAYVGPGAGVAFAATVFVLLSTVVVAVVGVLFWPVRKLWRAIRLKRPPKRPQIKRAVIVGLDGLDPVLTEQFMAEGKLPNMKALAARGGFTPLKTTYPAMSPVAWSSFATGVHPPKHGIFDFLTRDRDAYLPVLSSADVGPPSRMMNVGPWRLPIGKARLRLLRRSVPFWRILGQHQVPCSILRVPITFPAEPIEGGTMLSAMCVPDLKGTQGSFAYFSSVESGEESIGGERVPVQIVTEGNSHAVKSILTGPENPIRQDGARLELPLSLTLAEGAAELQIGNERHTLTVGAFSAWVPVAFPMGMGLKVRGICRFRLLECDPAGGRFRLYVTPINIDPAKPMLPVASPSIFSVFLARLIGRFATLGLAEDTWALNEGVLDEEAFLEQAWANHAERESMFFEMLGRMNRGVVACVFDGTDRIQHMFMRYLDDEHPARRREDPERVARYEGVISETYARMDEMLGRVMQQVDPDDPDTLLVVMSDHGFKSFRRGVNLNSWLLKEGYLVLEEGAEATTGEWFRGVDWDRTRAFALGLGGIFLNVKGREGRGCVAPGAEAEALADEIADKLTGMVDPEIVGVREDGTEGPTEAIHKAWTAHRIFHGPYAEDAPDIIVGYAPGWRASWDGVRGIANDIVFDDNTKAWSGDHCIDPEQVPGVWISNRPMGRPDGETPSITDVAPTLLTLFGVKPLKHMDGVVMQRPQTAEAAR